MTPNLTRPPPSRHERSHRRVSTRLGRLALVALALATLLGAGAGCAVPPSFTKVLDAGIEHTCAVLADNTVHCWGLNTSGQLGYGNSTVPGKAVIGNNEDPASAGAVDFGGPSAVMVAAGGFHSCAILEDLKVRCWGLGNNGQLGYNGTDTIGDDETLAAVANVDLGANRTAALISVGSIHTCAILDNGKVRCWGSNGSGQLGYANSAVEPAIGDDETPASAGFVDLGNGRTAKTIAAGGVHTCAILDNDKVRCWGYNGSGQLGYGNIDNIGDDETPASAGYVDLGSGGLTAKDIAAGDEHTCVILSNDKVRCWGEGFYGALGYGSTDDIGDDEIPNTATVGHVQLGGVDAIRITAGGDHTCANLANFTTRCWGRPSEGKLGLNLGLASTENIGDGETPDSVDPVDLTSRPEPRAITAGTLHTCAAFSNGGVLCWGNGEQGALGRGNTRDIGDDETPGSVPADINLGGPVRI